MIGINDSSPLNIYSPELLRQKSVKMIAYPGTVRNVYVKQALSALLYLRQHSNTKDIANRFASPEEFRNLTGLEHYEDLEKEFATLTD
jgi:2-methylisocitrate lyase-like PEP mutase family enzyme